MWDVAINELYGFKQSLTNKNIKILNYLQKLKFL